MVGLNGILLIYRTYYPKVHGQSRFGKMLYLVCGMNTRNLLGMLIQNWIGHWVVLIKKNLLVITHYGEFRDSCLSFNERTLSHGKYVCNQKTISYAD